MDALKLRLAPLAVGNGKIQIIASKAADDDCRLTQLQRAQNILAHMGRSRGSERHRLRIAQSLAHATQAKVIRSEVVPPLAQAVRFVHRQQRNLHAAQQIHEALLRKAFGGHVQHLQLAISQSLHHLAVFLSPEGGVHRRSGNPPGLQCVHLVLHQGNQGRDHHREPGPAQRRELVAERFTTTRGHDTHGIPTGKNSLHHFVLPRAKCIETKIGTQRLLHICYLSEFCHAAIIVAKTS